MENEKRLIDANAIEAKIEKNFKKLIANQNRPDLSAALSYVGDLIIEAPTVDAVEVVHGRWVQMEFWPGGGTWRCSECGYQVMFMEDTPYAKAMHYCPNCGAKMDGERREGE